MTKLQPLACLLVLIGLALSAAADACRAETRVALVIGNAHYLNTPALANPGNDASDVAQALADVGFNVTLRLDAGKRDFDQALAQFSRDARSADAALFYYAGHGMQFQGRNYVMPVDAVLEDEVSLRYEMTALDDVKAALQTSAGVKILVLDSCRDNPLAEKFVRSIRLATRDVPKVQGLARPERTNGMIIVYATQADDVANDGAGRNSPFSQAFLKELKTPGLEVGTLFRRVEDDVFAATGGRQSPELSISMVPEYFLNQAETDQTVWARVRSSGDAAALRNFLGRYPDSFYAPDAKAQLELIGQTGGKAIATSESPTPASLEPDARTSPKVASLNGSVQVAPSSIAVATAGPPLLPLIRAEMRRLGCYAGGDLDWDAELLQKGVARYARYANFGPAPLQPDVSLLNDMRKRPAGLCPPECSSREAAVGGRCVAKTCPRGELLTLSGACVAKPPSPRPPRRAVAASAERKAAAGGHCFEFNGKQYCE